MLCSSFVVKVFQRCHETKKTPIDFLGVKLFRYSVSVIPWNRIILAEIDKSASKPNALLKLFGPQQYNYVFFIIPIHHSYFHGNVCSSFVLLRKITFPRLFHLSDSLEWHPEIPPPQLHEVRHFFFQSLLILKMSKLR